MVIPDKLNADDCDRCPVNATISFPWLRLVSGRKNKPHLFVKPKRFLSGTITNKIMQTTKRRHIRNFFRRLKHTEVSLQLFCAYLTYFALCYCGVFAYFGYI